MADPAPEKQMRKMRIGTRKAGQGSGSQIVPVRRRRSCVLLRVKTSRTADTTGAEFEMTEASNLSRYGRVAMTLHWLIAIAVILNICLGLYMSEILADGNFARRAILPLHKSIGLSVLALSLLRLGWRMATPAPPLPDMSPRLRLLARADACSVLFSDHRDTAFGMGACFDFAQRLRRTLFRAVSHSPNPAFLTSLSPTLKGPCTAASMRRMWFWRFRPSC